MKKLTILLFSILISFSSYGEWTQYGASVKGGKSFIDYDSIYTRNTLTYGWILNKPKEIVLDKYRSAKQLLEIDCGLRNFKNIQYIVYEDTEAKSNPLAFSLDDDKPIYPPPNSVWHSIITKICKN